MEQSCARVTGLCAPAIKNVSAARWWTGGGARFHMSSLILVVLVYSAHLLQDVIRQTVSDGVRHACEARNATALSPGTVTKTFTGWRKPSAGGGEYVRASRARRERYARARAFWLAGQVREPVLFLLVGREFEQLRQVLQYQNIS